MKKHIVTILVIVLVASLLGVGAYLLFKNTKKEPLYNSHSAFVLSQDSDTLITNISAAENLYQTKVAVDRFEQDLNSYLVLTKSKDSTSNKLSKKYKNLTKERQALIVNYKEYITRMSGNIYIDGNAPQNLYNQIFDKTVQYLYSYSSCFNSTTSYVFEKVYKVDTLKEELYALYSAGITSLLNDISNHQFENINLVLSLNNKINLTENNNIALKSSIDGGEYSTEALNFKKYYNQSNISTLIENLKTINPSTIDPSTETSSEKLTIYYMNQILEV